MKKKIVSKVFAILLAACTVLSACGNESGNQSVGQTDKSETNDTVQEGEEPYTIVYAFDVWVQQADWDLVEENLSNIVYDKIGAKVKLLPMTGANYQQEVNLMITSGEKLDLVNASARTTFSSDVTSNKLLGLDEETVRKYAPDIALGGGVLGSRISDQASFDILDCFVGNGGTFIDTANVYGRWNPGNLPLSELLIGRWMKQHRLRSKLVVATKGACHALETPNIKRLAPEEIREDLESSLKSLQTDYIDLYYLHADDPKREVGEIIETLNSFVREGKVRYFACSNWSAERMWAADAYAKEHNLKSFVGHEIMFNLAKPNDEAVEAAVQTHMTENIYEYHQKTGKPVTAYTSQAAGFFVLHKEEGFLKDDKFAFPRDMFYNAESLKRAERVDELCKLTNATPLEITLAYLYAQPFQVIPIVGPCRVKELEESLRASEKRLTQEEVEFLFS